MWTEQSTKPLCASLVELAEATWGSLLSPMIPNDQSLKGSSEFQEATNYSLLKQEHSWYGFWSVYAQTRSPCMFFLVSVIAFSTHAEYLSFFKTKYNIDNGCLSSSWVYMKKPWPHFSLKTTPKQQRSTRSLTSTRFFHTHEWILQTQTDVENCSKYLIYRKSGHSLCWFLFSVWFSFFFFSFSRDKKLLGKNTWC